MLIKPVGNWTLRSIWRIVFAVIVLVLINKPVRAQGPTGGGKGPIASIRFGGTGDPTPNRVPSRSLNGVGRDSHDKVVAGALVYLKNVKTATTLSMTTDENGAYRFVGLNKNVDYEFWAQVEKHKSDIKTVSSFESTVQMVRNLQMK